jgi:hypothetical protein
MQSGLLIGKGIFWVLIWFGFMLFYTALDVAVWRKIGAPFGKYFNLVTMILCIAVFLFLLTRAADFKIDLLEGLSPHGLLLAAACAGLFYLVLDKGLDPLFEAAFPASEESYQDTLRSLRAAPVVSLIQVCVLAPFIEEVLMRGFLLGGLSVDYGKTAALLVSAFFFALLHFNMVQTLSAFLCGIVLGLLYLHTGSVSCCIAAHMGYNLISYLTMMVPLNNKA